MIGGPDGSPADGAGGGLGPADAEATVGDAAVPGPSSPALWTAAYAAPAVSTTAAATSDTRRGRERPVPPPSMTSTRSR